MTCLSNAIIAGGVIPDILDAAPRVGGLILFSFSTTSFERLPTFVKSKLFGKIRFSSFLNDLISVFENSEKAGELNCVLANTVKGKGCKLMEHKKHWHYYNFMSKEEIKQARKELS